METEMRETREKGGTGGGGEEGEGGRGGEVCEGKTDDGPILLVGPLGLDLVEGGEAANEAPKNGVLAVELLALGERDEAMRREAAGAQAEARLVGKPKRKANSEGRGREQTGSAHATSSSDSSTKLGLRRRIP